jgi:hypothetical protein
MLDDRASACLDIAQQFINLAALLERERASRIDEAPLTPDQFRKRQERDRNRQQKIRDIEATASRRVAEIKQKVGK